MIPTTTLLIKHGVQSLFAEENDFFKQNITHSLALKLHESISETKKEVQKHLLESETITDNTQELQEFVQFIDKFNPGFYTFKNGTSINITESEVQQLKKLFESLNPKNRQRMVSEIFTDIIKFKEHINFSQKVSKLI
jgi:Ca2+-binding EF-hand superfamily protein